MAGGLGLGAFATLRSATYLTIVTLGHNRMQGSLQILESIREKKAAGSRADERAISRRRGLKHRPISPQDPLPAESRDTVIEDV